jgi:hypothetical protein
LPAASAVASSAWPLVSFSGAFCAFWAFSGAFSAAGAFSAGFDSGSGSGSGSAWASHRR